MFRDIESLLDEGQAIEFLGLGSRPNPRGSLHRLCTTGRLPFVRIARGILRFRLEDLQAFVSKQRVGAKD